MQTDKNLLQIAGMVKPVLFVFTVLFCYRQENLWFTVEIICSNCLKSNPIPIICSQTECEDAHIESQSSENYDLNKTATAYLSLPSSNYYTADTQSQVESFLVNFLCMDHNCKPVFLVKNTCLSSGIWCCYTLSTLVTVCALCPHSCLDIWYA